MRRAALAVLTAGLVLLPSAALGDDAVFRLADDRITESSGLVDLGATMVTVNDSGDSARVFTLDAGTGETVGVTTWDADAYDIEALAPAGRDHVWVGDIGDNEEQRDSVTVYRVPVGVGERDAGRVPAYELHYPDGPRDAESLVALPDGELVVVTKALTGGAVYRTEGRPEQGRRNRMVLVGAVEDYATDAALLAGGTRLLVRGYGQASVYTYPALRLLGRVALPSQRQGEGISVGPGDRVRLSSEGVRAPVLQVALPEALVRPVPTASASPSVSPSPTPIPAPERPRRDEVDTAGTSVLGWGVGIGGLLVAVVVGLAVRRRH